MVAVSVLVPVTDDLEQVKKLVRSLDRQTLPSDDFEVVLQAGVDQLDMLAAHRPNLRVVRTTDPARHLLAAAEGDFVLTVGQDETLFPGSLARLRDFAEQHDVDAVVARVVVPGTTAPAELWTDAERSEDPAIVRASSGPADAVRSQLFVRRDAAELTDRGQLQTATTRVGVLGSHAITLRGQAAGQPPEEAGSAIPAVTVEGADWRGGSLHLVLRTAGRGSASGERRAVLELRHADTQETLLVPAEMSTAGRPDRLSSDGTSGRPEVHVEAAIAPTRTPAAGQQLATGRWHVGLVLAGGGEAVPPVPVPWSPCPPALIGGVAVVPAPTRTGSGRQSLTLDVGPTHHALLSNLDPGEGTVTESVVGSELVLNLPQQLHVFDSDGLDGFIALDKMRLPARIRVRDGRAQLVALVSGLAGRSVISAQFGPGPLRATGLSLQITGDGAMSVIKTPPPTPPAPAKPPSAPGPVAKDTTAEAAGSARAKRRKRRKKAEPPRTGLVADLRRAVPTPLEPVVKRLASIPAARRLYRRATR